jgi:D-alanyl-D-alanine dipeptidase
MPIAQKKHATEAMVRALSNCELGGEARAIRSRRQTGVAAAVLSLWLTACAQGPGPHAPMAASLGAGTGARTVSTATSSCSEAPAAVAELERVAQELRAKGLALHARCHGAGQGWVMGLRVVDDLVASRTVRGPLAAGEDVDMGTPLGASLAGARYGAEGFSPDVEHNRAWLRALMARHQFDNLPDAWWHFARRDGGSPAKAAVPLPPAARTAAAGMAAR